MIKHATMEQIKGFFTPTLEPQTLTCVSRLYFHSQHWDPDRRSSSACLTPGPCPGCSAGLKIQRLGLVAVRSSEAEPIWLLRFPSTLPKIVQSFAAKGGELVGTLISVEKNPSPTQSAPVVAVLGRTPPRPIPVEKYIASIGLKAAQRLATDLAMADFRAR